MNIQLNNFGPIKKFDFDLSKDLTLILGRNNIGKSYAISAIYLILKSFTTEEFNDNQIEFTLFYYRRHQIQGRFRDSKLITDILALEEFLTRTLKQKDEVEITNELKKLFTSLIGTLIVPNLEKSFSNSFDSLGSLKNKLSNNRLSIVLSFKSFEFTISVLKSKLVISSLKFHEKVIIKKSGRKKKSEKKDNQYILYYSVSRKDNLGTIDALFLEYFVAFKNEITQSLSNIYFLPASRSGLYQALSAFNAVIAELSKSRTFLSNKLELPNISEPVLDYFLSLANVNDKGASKKFSDIVKIIEGQILGGVVSFNNETKKLVFSPKNIEGELDLAFTSSMISEIAPIVAFFKYIISDEVLKRQRYRIDIPIQTENKTKPANLIFIEEPEAHLHPEVQVKLMEVFCEITKYDVKIVMTSHSNYMFNKLSNLVLEDKISHEKISSCLMIMSEFGSVIDTVSMAANKEGINDNNFVDVAEKLYEERILTYDKLNKNAN